VRSISASAMPPSRASPSMPSAIRSICGSRFGTAVDCWGDVGEDVVGQAESFGHGGHLCDLVGVLLDHDHIQVDGQTGLVRGGKGPLLNLTNEPGRRVTES
jgi:hypothetical protein